MDGFGQRPLSQAEKDELAKFDTAWADIRKRSRIPGEIQDGQRKAAMQNISAGGATLAAGRHLCPL